MLGGGDGPTDLKIHACDGEIVHGWAVDRMSGRAVTLSAAGHPIAPARTHAGADQALVAGDRLRARFVEASRFAAALSAGVYGTRGSSVSSRGGSATSPITPAAISW